MKYTDVNGVERTLTKYQRALLLLAATARHNHLQYPDTRSARLLEERGLLTTQEWHCPLDPYCVTSVTPRGVTVARLRRPTK